MFKIRRDHYTGAMRKRQVTTGDRNRHDFRNTRRVMTKILVRRQLEGVFEQFASTYKYKSPNDTEIYLS
jgi:hypothetical protein